jgi:hypothetical protein
VVPEDRAVAVEDQDASGAQGGADPVGDDHQRAAGRKGFLGPPFGLWVEVAGGFVQYRQRSGGQIGPDQCDQPPLAGRQPTA